jgi:acyl-coenzyme A synthetase/AMP-(fatty) acid ligase
MLVASATEGHPASETITASVGQHPPEPRLGAGARMTAMPDPALPFPTIVDAVERHADVAGHSVALGCEGRDVTYAELDTAANRIAHLLLETDASNGAMVPICMPMSVELVIALTGVMKAGLPFAYVDPKLSDIGLRERVENTQGRCMLGDATTSRHLRALFGKTHTVLDAEAAAEASSVPATRPAVARDARDLAFVRYTSGSTGLPKGVMCSQGCAAFAAWCWTELTSLTPRDRVGVFQSFWSSIVLGTLYGGATLHVVGVAQGGFGVLAPAIRRHRITVLTTFPSAFRQFATGIEEAASLASLRCVSL